MKSTYKLAGIVAASAISALGTLPYGFHFSGIFVSPNTLIYILLGCFFAACSVTANATLGAYSLLEINPSSYRIGVLLIGLLGAIPTGFICFFGFQKILFLSVNIATCFVITLVNGAINYAAINNLLYNLKYAKQPITLGEIIFRIAGVIIGLIVSIINYLAAADGLTSLLIFYHWEGFWGYKLGFILAIFTWMPSAALYANTTQVIGGALYKFLSHFLSNLKKINVYDVILLIIITASGSALTQIAIEFYSHAEYIPDFFKSQFVQASFYPHILPIVFLTSVAVNFFAAREIFIKYKFKKIMRVYD